MSTGMQTEQARAARQKRIQQIAEWEAKAVQIAADRTGCPTATLFTARGFEHAHNSEILCGLLDSPRQFIEPASMDQIVVFQTAGAAIEAVATLRLPKNYTVQIVSHTLTRTWRAERVRAFYFTPDGETKDPR